MKSPLLTLCFIMLAISAWPQQIPDTSRFFTIADPQFTSGQGPVVIVDAAHNNFHTLDGRYAAFGNILKGDGYRTVSNEKPITPEVLADCDIYVISNPLHASNVGNWQVPNPSAFTPEEITALQEWVDAGGRLFLIADHMPLAGAAQDLGRAFGFEFFNCFATDNNQTPDYFSYENGMLHDTEITQGIDSILTFTGSAFAIPTNATSLASFSEEFILLLPVVAWQFTDDTPFFNGKGLHQLAYRTYGEGKVFVSGEAAMFSAQLAGPQQQRMGLNNPAARKNIDLLRRIMAWLAS